MTSHAWPLACLLTILGGQVASPAFAADKSRPNVLFIAVDDLNTWVGHLKGHPQARTPNIDRLAKRGMSFTQAYATAASCTPSRSSLLSGQRPSTTGIYGNGHSWYPVLKDTTTLPQHFMKNGYFVAGGGKLFHGFDDEMPHLRDYWHEYLNKAGGVAGSKYLDKNGLKREHFDWAGLDVPEDKMGDHQLARWAAEKLATTHDKPLFLGVGFVRPHLPWYVPQKYFDMHPLETIVLPVVKPDDLEDIPPAGRNILIKGKGDHQAVTQSGQWKEAVRAYLASISFVDAQIGILLDALEKGPLAKNTIVVLWGDHGWHLGEKLHWRKFALWERATQTPLLISFPGVIKPNSRCNRSVDLINVYPTLSDLAGLPMPTHLDGLTLRPLLKNPSAPWSRPAVTINHRDQAVRDDRWRYIRYADGSEELYDHKVDPHEWHNLASDPRLTAIKTALAGHFPKVNVPPSTVKKHYEGAAGGGFD